MPTTWIYTGDCRFLCLPTHNFYTGENKMNIPKDLKYTENDEWIKVDGKIGTIGITDHAQDQLSDIVYVEIVVSEDEEISQGDSCATLESVKAAADVYAPVSGKVIAINDELPDTPEVVNSDPYGKAWMLKIELSDPSELDGLMDAAAYEASIADAE
jgi:glycine cleavage system H protein